MISTKQQAIFRMVLNNSTIVDFERANVCTFAYFGADYKYLAFVLKRYNEYGTVNMGDMVAQFIDLPTVDLDGISEDVDLLIYSLKEEYIFEELHAMVKRGQEKYSEDGIQLLNFFEERITQLRDILPTMNAYDIFSHIKDRRMTYEENSKNPKVFIPTGFPEIDKMIGGWSKSGELASFLARMGMGKTWILIKSCLAAWAAGFRCGFLSIEMGADNIGLRMDSMLSGLSNSALRKGEPVDMAIYNKYVEEYCTKNGIIVRSKRDFGGHITPNKIANWIRNDKLDAIYLDGIGYVESERINARTKSDAALTTDISEDLMSISVDEHCPVILTQQASRGGADRSANPGLETARGSDGVNINASFVASLAYPDIEKRDTIRVEVLKSRYGRTGAKLDYKWNPDIGVVEFIGDASNNSTANTNAGAYYGS